jgi:fatty acid CoA ligase FadD21
VHFDTALLSTGKAQRCAPQSGTPLLSYGRPSSPAVRIVEGDTAAECAPESVGEIWVSGDNVADGYWNKPDQTRHTFGAWLTRPDSGTPDGPWLRTGDLGFLSDGELFIVGRIKDVLIVYGRNHYPEDIEATVSAITGGRVAAISVPAKERETLVTIVEVKPGEGTVEQNRARLGDITNGVRSAVSNTHDLTVADVVPVAPGAIPTTTSGKIRRSACVDLYRNGQFARLDT